MKFSVGNVRIMASDSYTWDEVVRLVIDHGARTGLIGYVCARSVLQQVPILRELCDAPDAVEVKDDKVVFRWDNGAPYCTFVVNGNGECSVAYGCGMPA